MNMIYSPGIDFPKKPAKVMMHNPNLMYAIYPIAINQQDIMETFFVNTVWKDHIVNEGNKPQCYMIDNSRKVRICDAHSANKLRYNSETIYARYNTEVGHDNQIPLWLFGFLY